MSLVRQASLDALKQKSAGPAEHIASLSSQVDPNDVHRKIFSLSSFPTPKFVTSINKTLPYMGISPWSFLSLTRSLPRMEFSS